MSNFKILNIPDNSSKDDIKKAYKKLAKELHPDVNGGDLKKAAQFIKVNDAYKALLNGVTGITKKADTRTRSSYRTSYEDISLVVTDGRFNDDGSFTFFFDLNNVQEIHLESMGVYWTINRKKSSVNIKIDKVDIKKCKYNLEFRIIGWSCGRSIYKSYKLKKRKSVIEKKLDYFLDKINLFFNFTK